MPESQNRYENTPADNRGIFLLTFFAFKGFDYKFDSFLSCMLSLMNWTRNDAICLSSTVLSHVTS